ncbi:MAG: hypothetical protein IJ593_12780 [Lachnospiraceae bacterium]|nr:hypothetical protein [Lachnospiraceae bacterium]
MKYSKEFKLEMIQRKKKKEYIPVMNGYSQRRWGDVIRKWERIYDYLGEAGLEHNKPKLSLDDKIIMIKRVHNGESITEVAFSYGRRTEYLSKLIKIYRQNGIDGLKSLKQGRKKKMKKPSKDKNKSELEQLREENEYLRAENEYLKKLRALIQEEEKDQSPCKK